MTDSRFIAPRMRHSSLLFDTRAVVVLIAMAIAPTSVLAVTQVRGSPEAVSLDAQDTSIEDILAALGASFGVHYKSTAKLERRLTGTYSGSLQRVVARILEGYNFTTKVHDGRVEITVLGMHSGADSSKASPNPPAVTALAAASIQVTELPANTPPLAPIKVTEALVPAASGNASASAAPVPRPLAPGSIPPLVAEPHTSAAAPPMPLTPQAPGSAPPLVPEVQTSGMAPPMLLTPVEGSAKPADHTPPPAR
jgi:hypothetical protein